MTLSYFGTSALAVIATLAIASSDANAQYLPNQYFAPGYGSYYRTYPTPNGGIVNRTSNTTPYGTTYTKQYFNPYTGYSNNSYSTQSAYGVYNNYNSGFISPALTPYYGGTGYGNLTYVIPYYVNGVRVR